MDNKSNPCPIPLPPMLVVYSAEDAERRGTVVYELADGRIVEGTAVRTVENLEFYGVGDVVILGLYKRFVKTDRVPLGKRET